MSTRRNHNTSDLVNIKDLELYKLSVREYQEFSGNIESAFIQEKLALAIIALLRRGATFCEIAKELHLKSDDSVRKTRDKFGRGQK